MKGPLSIMTPTDVSAVLFVSRPKEIGLLSSVSNHEQPNFQEIEP
jgi:hypothetical protein